MSLKQVSDLLGIHENTIKGYMLKHPEFVRFDKEHNRYRIHVEAIEVLKTIRKLYGDGMKREGVDEYLRGSGVPVTITVANPEDGKDLISINESMEEMKNILQVVIQKNEADKQELIQKAEADKKELKEAFLQKLEEAEKKADEIERERVERERLLLQEMKESKQLHQQEIGEVKKLLNQQEAKRVSELRSTLEESKLQWKKFLHQWKK